jgi:cell division ATPase FtsA
MGLFSKKEEIIIVLDISSGGVSGVVVLKNQKEPPFVLSSVKKEIKISYDLDPKILEKNILEEIDHVCEKLQKDTLLRPDKIYCVLATPWSDGQLRSISLKRDKEFKFTESLAQELILNEIKEIKKDHHEGMQIIDEKIFQISLNGYNIDKPEGKYAKSLDIKMFFSLTSRSVVRKIEDKVQKTFKSRIFFTSQMLADFIFIRNLSDGKKDSIVLDIGLEFTEMLLMKNAELWSVGSFAFGKNNLTKIVSETMQKSLPETQSLISSFANKHLDEGNLSPLEKAIDFALTMWQSSLKETLLEIWPKRHIPESIFLIADDNMSDLFYNKLSYAFFGEFTISSLDFNVIIITRSMLHNFCSLAEGVNLSPSVFIKTIFINQNH